MPRASPSGRGAHKVSRVVDNQCPLFWDSAWRRCTSVLASRIQISLHSPSTFQAFFSLGAVVVRFRNRAWLIVLRLDFKAHLYSSLMNIFVYSTIGCKIRLFIADVAPSFPTQEHWRRQPETWLPSLPAPEENTFCLIMAVAAKMDQHIRSLAWLAVGFCSLPSHNVLYMRVAHNVLHPLLHHTPLCIAFSRFTFIFTALYHRQISLYI